MPIEFCGCKNRCAEEDRGRTRPNERGICRVATEDLGNPTPTSLAEEIFFAMGSEERSTAIRQGAANMEDRIKERAPNWAESAIESCLNEIAQRCADAAEED